MGAFDQTSVTSAELGRGLGLVDDTRWRAFERYREQLERLNRALDDHWLRPDTPVAGALVTISARLEGLSNVSLHTDDSELGGTGSDGRCRVRLGREKREILRESPGIVVDDKRGDGGYTTPVDCVGDYATFISRIRDDITAENAISLWCVSDNLRKGAALNAVQIAELLGRRCLKKG